MNLNPPVLFGRINPMNLIDNDILVSITQETW